MNVLRTVPMLRIFDESMAKAFYTDFLGFEVEWEHRFEPNLPVYMQARRGECVLHLTGHHGDCCPGAKVFREVAGLEEYVEGLRRAPFFGVNPAIQDAPWGSHVCEVVDPFGNRLLFNER